jgi:hypothetical protein
MRSSVRKDFVVSTQTFSRFVSTIGSTPQLTGLRPTRQQEPHWYQSRQNSVHTKEKPFQSLGEAGFALLSLSLDEFHK